MRCGLGKSTPPENLLRVIATFAILIIFTSCGESLKTWFDRNLGLITVASENPTNTKLDEVQKFGDVYYIAKSKNSEDFNLSFINPRNIDVKKVDVTVSDNSKIKAEVKNISKTSATLTVTNQNQNSETDVVTITLRPEATAPNQQPYDMKVKFAEWSSYKVGNVNFKMCSFTPCNNVMIQERLVTLTPYTIGETEVTQGLWEAVMPINPSTNKKGDNFPVETVSWYDCVAFCNELTKKVFGNGNSTDECVYYSDAGYKTVYKESDAKSKSTAYMNINKKGFRLPTEAEWEYAASGGQDYTYSGSNTINDVAWYDGNSGDSSNPKSTHEVKTKNANGYNIYDMSGNVYEWCYDWYDAATPTGNLDPLGPESSKDTTRVIRGGSWFSFAETCGRAFRLSNGPGGVLNYFGFRVVCRP